MKSVRVNPLQAALLVAMVTVGTVFFPVAGIVVPIAGVSGWISVSAAFIIAAPWAALAGYISSHGPVGDWGKAVKYWLGPWVGRLFLLYFVFVWTWLGGLLLGQGGLVFHSVALPRTPPYVLMVMLLLLIVLIDIRGVEVFTRTVEALFMIGLPLLAGLMVGVVPTAHLQNLKPWIEEAPIRIAHASLITLPWAMEGILFALFIGVHVKNKRSLKLASLFGVLAGGLALVLTVFATVAVLGRTITQSFLYPTVALSQAAHVGFFLRGVELFLYPFWLLASFIKTSACFILVSESICGIYPRIKQPYRAIALGGLFMFIATLPENLPSLVASLGRLDNTFMMLFYAILPLLGLWLAMGRKKEEDSA